MANVVKVVDDCEANEYCADWDKLGPGSGPLVLIRAALFESVPQLSEFQLSSGWSNSSWP